MDNAELKEALTTQVPVMHNGIEYKRISAIIYRMDGNKLIIQAELLDKNQNSITIASPERINKKE